MIFVRPAGVTSREEFLHCTFSLPKSARNINIREIRVRGTQKFSLFPEFVKRGIDGRRTSGIVGWGGREDVGEAS